MNFARDGVAHRAIFSRARARLARVSVRGERAEGVHLQWQLMISARLYALASIRRDETRRPEMSGDVPGDVREVGDMSPGMTRRNVHPLDGAAGRAARRLSRAAAEGRATPSHTVGAPGCSAVGCTRASCIVRG